MHSTDFDALAAEYIEKQEETFPPGMEAVQAFLHNTFSGREPIALALNGSRGTLCFWTIEASTNGGHRLICAKPQTDARGQISIAVHSRPLDPMRMRITFHEHYTADGARTEQCELRWDNQESENIVLSTTEGDKLPIRENPLRSRLRRLANLPVDRYVEDD